MTHTPFRDLPLRRKLTWGFVLACSVALLLACVALLTYDSFAFRQTLAMRLVSQAEIVGHNSASALIFNDAAAAQITLSALRADPRVVFAAIYQPNGALFAAYRPSGGASSMPQPPNLTEQTDNQSFHGNVLVLTRRIVADESLLGTVYIQYDLEEMFQRMKRYAGILALVWFVSILLSLVISARVRDIISEPILRLSETAKIVSAQRDYSVRAPSGNRDEIGLLIETFNEMLDRIVSDIRVREESAALRQSEERYRALAAELQAANKELEAFTYSVSHDLRAPLRHVDGFSQVLLQKHAGQLDEQGQHYLKRVRYGAQQMGRLVDDLLNLSRVGRQEFRPVLAGLDPIVQEVLRELQAETRERQIEWLVGNLPFVECDPVLMRQVFANLLSNAVKYTRTRPRAVIEVGSCGSNGATGVFVRDNGVGFSMKYADKLFGIFQRLHRQEDFEGTGVGLATVQRIIHRHGGRVWAEAELDRGATFYFTLSPSVPEHAGETVNAAQGGNR